jgi:hypothetical protein
MSNPETPKHNDEIAKARFAWAESFLMDWLVDQVKLNRIDTPDDIIHLREAFPAADEEGTDFTLHDVWVVAAQWRENDYPANPLIPEQLLQQLLPSHKALDRLIELLDTATHDPSQSEDQP